MEGWLNTAMYQGLLQANSKDGSNRRKRKQRWWHGHCSLSSPQCGRGGGNITLGLRATRGIGTTGHTTMRSSVSGGGHGQPRYGYGRRAPLRPAAYRGHGHGGPQDKEDDNEVQGDPSCIIHVLDCSTILHLDCPLLVMHDVE